MLCRSQVYEYRIICKQVHHVLKKESRRCDAFRVRILYAHACFYVPYQCCYRRTISRKILFVYTRSLSRAQLEFTLRARSRNRGKLAGAVKPFERKYTYAAAMLRDYHFTRVWVSSRIFSFNALFRIAAAIEISIYRRYCCYCTFCGMLPCATKSQFLLSTLLLNRWRNKEKSFSSLSTTFFSFFFFFFYRIKIFFRKGNVSFWRSTFDEILSWRKKRRRKLVANARVRIN